MGPPTPKLVWEPYPQKIQVGKFLVKLDGKNLPNSVTEDIGGYVLCPKYSKKQLRKIERLHRTRNNYEYGNGSLKLSNLKKSQRSDIHQNKQVLLERAYNEECI